MSFRLSFADQHLAWQQRIHKEKFSAANPNPFQTVYSTSPIKSVNSTDSSKSSASPTDLIKRNPDLYKYHHKDRIPPTLSPLQRFSQLSPFTANYQLELRGKYSTVKTTDFRALPNIRNRASSLFSRGSDMFDSGFDGKNIEELKEMVKYERTVRIMQRRILAEEKFIRS